MVFTLATLTDRIAYAHDRAQGAAVQQVNYWLTARNWLVGLLQTTSQFCAA